MGNKGAERSGWRGHIWRQKEDDVCVAVVKILSLSPNLSKKPGNIVQILWKGQENLHSKWGERLPPTCQLLPQRRVRK